MAWLKHNTVSGPADGKSVTFDLQAGNPKNGLDDVGDVPVPRSGKIYTVTRTMDTTTVVDGVTCTIRVDKEHLGIDKTYNQHELQR